MRLLAAIVGAWAVWFATSNGVGVSRDSITYLRGAEHIAEGEGYVGVGDSGRFGPVNHWPPLYSMTIALPIAAGLSTTDAARLVNALALFVLLYASALLARRLAPDATVAPILVMLAILVAPTILRSYIMAWSEAIFLPLVVAGFAKVHDYFARDRLRDLAVAGVCFGLAAIDRYSGVAFIAGLAIALVVRGVKTRGPYRFVRPLLFIVVAGLPMAAWVARNMMVAARAHDRPFSPHLPSVNHVRALLDSLSLWLLPPSVPFRLRLLGLFFAMVLLGVVLRRVRVKHDTGVVAGGLERVGVFWVVAGLCVAVYLAFVLVTISFFDFDVNYDTRMMSPVLVLAIIFFGTAGRAVWARPLSMAVKFLSALMVAATLLVAGHSADLVRAAHDEPAQYASDRWAHARAWEVVASAPADVPVYASSPYVSAHFVERDVLPITDAAPSGGGYVLFYPNLEGAGSALDPETLSLLNAETVDSSETVILYRIEP